VSKTEITTDYPKTFVWEEDAEDLGDRYRLEGTFLALEEGPTAQGSRPILVLEIGGVPRSVWVLHGPFHDKLKEEIERRATPEFIVGERMVFERWKDKATSESTGRSYTPYKAWFIDRPKRSEADILGAIKKQSDVAVEDVDLVAATDGNGQDSDIPF
jgi:hypothetical protein